MKKKVLFKDIPIGTIFTFSHGTYQKIEKSYDFAGAYNAVSIENKNAREYITDNEYIEVEGSEKRCD